MRWIEIKPLTKQTLPSFSPLVSPPPPPPSNHKPNSAVIFARNIVILLGVVFFLCGLLHFLVRCLVKKKRATNSHHQSSGFQETTDAVAYERQLQQLFHLHDSGLDQTFIDALPLFLYKELMGSKEPFDCAVCLCEFSQNDKLRLLPLCSHAFHIHCIDTWLLSNSTCPLCRGTLFSPGFSTENPVFDFQFDDLMEEEDDNMSSNSGKNHVGASGNFKQPGGWNEKRVFPVRLGKFRATNGDKREEKEVGETSNSNLDARRCFSMGSYEYVVGNSELQLTFCPNRGNIGKKDLGIEKDRGNSSVDGGSDGKKISSKSKGESFSVSKIWLWSKKDQHNFQDSSGTNMINSTVNVSLPSRNSNASNFPH